MGTADDEERLARAAWSRIAEPADSTAGALVRAVGPVDALRWVESLAVGGPTWSPAREVSTTRASQTRATVAQAEAEAQAQAQGQGQAQAPPPPSPCPAPVTPAGPGEVGPTVRVGAALAGPAGSAAPCTSAVTRSSEWMRTPC